MQGLQHYFKAAAAGANLSAAVPECEQLIKQAFISYAGPDPAACTFAATMLKPALDAAGVPTTLDYTSLEPGDTFQRELMKAAAHSSVFVAVLSKQYVQRFWCMLELDLALHWRKQQQRSQVPVVLPVFFDDYSGISTLEDVKGYWAMQRITLPLIRLHWVDPKRWADNYMCCRQQLQNLRLSRYTGQDRESALATAVVQSAMAAGRFARVDSVPGMLGAEEQQQQLLDELMEQGNQNAPGDDSAAGALQPDAAPGGGHSDAAATRDSLGMDAAAKGVAAFLMHEETSPLAMAVFGPWGRGKSSFMQLVNQHMLLVAAARASGLTQAASEEDLAKCAQCMDAWARAGYTLGDAAQPLLRTVWFNAWQYLNETQVWAGLVVEVVKQLEGRLTWSQRRMLALRFHWQKNRLALLLRLVFPLFAIIAILTTLMGYGIVKINDHSGDAAEKSTTVKAATAAVAVAGCIVALLAVVERTTATVKQVSDSILDSVNYFTVGQAHKDKIGFQHEVKEDLKILVGLLQQEEHSLPARLLHKIRSLVPWQRLAAEQEQQQQQQQWNPRQLEQRLQQWEQQRQQQQRLKIVVFIDDLDRCRPNKVVEVLEAINVVLGPSGFTVVAGMDKGFIRDAVLQSYQGQVDEEKAEEFLQKIVQVSLTLSMPQQREMVQFLDQLGIGNNTASLTFLDSARNSRATLAGAKASQDSATATASEPSQQPAEPVAEIESGVHPGLLISQAPIKPPPQQQQQQQPEEDTLWLLASSAAGGYSADEVQAIQQLLKDGLLEGRSPREVKLLINQYRLAKMILLHGADKLTRAQHPILLVWVALWWRYPRGMQHLLKVGQRHTKNSLRELLLHTQQQATNAAATSVTAAGAGSSHAAAAAATAALTMTADPDASSRLLLLLPTRAEQEQLRGIRRLVLEVPGELGALYDIPWELAERFRLFGTEFADKPEEKKDSNSK